MSFIVWPFPKARRRRVAATSESQAPTISGEFSAWFKDKEFAFDWTSGHFATWSAILDPLKEIKLRVLEIGSYEGLSALFFLNFLPRSSIACIDPWDAATIEPAISRLVPGDAEQYPFAEGRFDRNLRPFVDRVTKIKGFSIDALTDLGLSRRRFDLIYVDGSHRRADAYRDCVLSWPLLDPDGIMLIDDYEFGAQLPDELKPKQAIDAFLANIVEQYDELHRAYQIAIRKR